MKRHALLLGVALALGLSACGSVPMTVSQGNQNLLLAPNRTPTIGGEPGGGVGVGPGDQGRRGWDRRPRMGINALREAITLGILANFTSGPDRTYSVSNVSFAEPRGAWRQLPFSATVSLIGIAGPSVPVSQTPVAGVYDRATGRVTLMQQGGAPVDTGANQPVDPRVI